MSTRIVPLEPPYTAEVQLALDKWTPRVPASAVGHAADGGVEPLVLFRTLARHERLSERMRGLGAVFLGSTVLTPRFRELLILRTCARLGCEYEWGIHAAAFGAAAGLEEEGIHATYKLSPASIASAVDEDSLALRLADELHDTARVSAELWSLLGARFGEQELLEMIAAVGFYHLISFTVNALDLDSERWAFRFPTGR